MPASALRAGIANQPLLEKLLYQTTELNLMPDGKRLDLEMCFPADVGGELHIGRVLALGQDGQSLNI
jgi:hypothetical protein